MGWFSDPYGDKVMAMIGKIAKHKLSGEKLFVLQDIGRQDYVLQCRKMDMTTGNFFPEELELVEKEG